MYNRSSSSQLLALVLSVTFISGQPVSGQTTADARDNACSQQCNARQAATDLLLEQINARLDRLEKSVEAIENQSQQRQPLQLQRQWTGRDRPGRLVSGL
jgi:TolA-binding protein